MEQEEPRLLYRQISLRQVMAGEEKYDTRRDTQYKAAAEARLPRPGTCSADDTRQDTPEAFGEKDIRGRRLRIAVIQDENDKFKGSLVYFPLWISPGSTR